MLPTSTSMRTSIGTTVSMERFLLSNRIHPRPWTPQMRWAAHEPFAMESVNRPRPMRGKNQLLWGAQHSYKLNKRAIFTIIECGTVPNQIMDRLTPLVHNNLIPVRWKKKALHLCAHFRLRNIETGDWQIKERRHVHSPSRTMNMTLQAMVKVTLEDENTQKQQSGTIAFVAGDGLNIQSWFRDGPRVR
uniref:Uncharacterized protein n=1 Tax=Craspedostauros australis TaxID=1486917 RepID=A0A7R9WTR7_9STRA|mmetsp:Transcript_20569/g.57186  ORF Transcript_20569/g.57186 Transcript_20569/m.57186 type:complete len:189 (+) Transcript_20569:405-971(+)